MLSKTSLALCLLASSSNAFTVPRVSSTKGQSILTRNVGLALDWDGVEDEAFLMKRAMDCASSDSCTLEDAEHYMESVLHVQSSCASGALIGSEICTDVVDAAETVATLREKIARESKKMFAMNASMSVVNVALLFAFLSAVVAGSVHVNPDVAPFTTQEWWWAIRDGYFPLMVQTYFRDGGLMGASPEASPFALQEWFWAVRDGYFMTMVEHYFQDGGLAGGESDGFASVPFTPQEWQWAVNGGYVDRVLAETFQTGGLSGVESGSDVVNFTPQEWVWAAQRGYLPQMTADFFRNGGL